MNSLRTYNDGTTTTIYYNHQNTNNVLTDYDLHKRINVTPRTEFAENIDMIPPEHALDVLAAINDMPITNIVFGGIKVINNYINVATILMNLPAIVHTITMQCRITQPVINALAYCIRTKKHLHTLVFNVCFEDTRCDLTQLFDALKQNETIIHLFVTITRKVAQRKLIARLVSSVTQLRYLIIKTTENANFNYFNDHSDLVDAIVSREHLYRLSLQMFLTNLELINSVYKIIRTAKTITEFCFSATHYNYQRQFAQMINTIDNIKTVELFREYHVVSEIILELLKSKYITDLRFKNDYTLSGYQHKQILEALTMSTVLQRCVYFQSFAILNDIIKRNNQIIPRVVVDTCTNIALPLLQWGLPVYVIIEIIDYAVDYYTQYVSMLTKAKIIHRINDSINRIKNSISM